LSSLRSATESNALWPGKVRERDRIHRITRIPRVGVENGNATGSGFAGKMGEL
jgi:hypothetical protein